MYEVRAIFGSEEKAKRMHDIFERVAKDFKLKLFKVLPDIEEYEHGTFCFYFQTDEIYVYNILDSIVTESDGATFMRAC